MVQAGERFIFKYIRGLLARIRTIKPEFTKDELLAELPIATRYLFAFLTTMADREGRLEDRPKLIRLEIFPWDGDSVDVEAMLEQLSGHFIIRYEVDGRRYIQIKTFAKHQRPNIKEVASSIPPYDSQTGKLVVKTSGNKTSKKRGTIKTVLSTNKTVLDAIQTIPSTLDKGKGRERERELSIAPELGAKEKTDLQRIVEAYKHAKNVPMDDKGWDKANFGRYSKAGKSLLACFNGDLKKSAAYLFIRGTEMDEKGLEWTLETISRQAWDGAGIPRGEDGRKNGAVDDVAFTKRSGSQGLTQAGEMAGNALRAIEGAKIPDDGPGELGVYPEIEDFGDSIQP